MTGRTQEEILVMKAQAGDARAFEMLYRAYQPSLVKFAYRITGNEASAKDAVQDAWITIARTLTDLNTPTMFRPRVFKAVRWRVLDHLRKRKFDGVPLSDTSEMELQAEKPAADGLATSDQLRTIIGCLPEIERQAIYLFYLEEMKLDEVGEVLGVPTGTVKSRLNRARRRLQELAQVKEEN